MLRRASPLILLLLSTVAVQARAQTGPVVFQSHRSSEELQLFGVGPQGKLLPSELTLLGDMMRCWRTNKTHAVHPRLAQHLAQISRHFRRPVVIVSGYRGVARSGHRHSFHQYGMAADVYVRGISPTKVRDLAVTREITGIGFYPNSGFIHIDVRERPFWWVDYSGPGQHDRLIPDPEGDAPAQPQEAKSLSTAAPAPPERGS